MSTEISAFPFVVLSNSISFQIFSYFLIDGWIQNGLITQHYIDLLDSCKDGQLATIAKFGDQVIKTFVIASYNYLL